MTAYSCLARLQQLAAFRRSHVCHLTPSPVASRTPTLRAALDRPGSLPSLFMVRPGWAVFVSAAYNLYADALFQGRARRSPSSLHSQEISTGRCLCHISPRACFARRAPPSPRVTRGTTLPAAAVAAAAALRAAPRCAGPSVRLRVALVPRPPGPFFSPDVPLFLAHASASLLPSLR